MKRKIQVVFGLGLGAFLVWLVFRDTDWPKVYAAARSAHWGWLLIGMVAMTATFVSRIWRWRYVVRTAKPVSFRHMFSSTQIGFLANFTLPGRAGELIRSLVLARLARLPVSKCIAFVALDRVTDLFGLISVLLVAVLAFRPAGRITLPPEIPVPDWAGGLLQPAVIRNMALGSAAFMAAIVVVLVLLYVNQRLALRVSDAVVGAVSKRLAERVHEMLRHFAEGLHVFRSAPDMAKSAFFSLVTWGLFAFSYECMLLAFSLELPWYAAFVTLSMVAVAISIPGAPGFIGQMHFGIYAALYVLRPDIDTDLAKAVALVTHVVNVIPVYVVGGVCLYYEQFGLLELRRETEQVEEELESESP